MMYAAAALAMILPLVDLHCGKSDSCKIEEFKAENTAFKAENTAFKAENVKMTGYNTAFKAENGKFKAENVKMTGYNTTFKAENGKFKAENGKFKAENVKLKNEVAKLAGVAEASELQKVVVDLPNLKTADLTLVAKEATVQSVVAQLPASSKPIASADDVAAVTSAVAAVKTKVDTIDTAVSGLKTGMTALHDEVTNKSTAGTIYDEIVGASASSGTTIKERVESVWNQVFKTATANTIYDEIVGASASSGTTIKERVASVHKAVTAKKKYVKVSATFGSTGTTALIVTGTPHECKIQTTPTDMSVPEDVLCCPSDVDAVISTFRNAKFTPASVTDSWDLSNKLCRMHGMQLCNASHLSKLSDTAQGIGAILSWTAGIPTSLRSPQTLSPSGTAAVFIWTSIECE